MGKYVKIPRPKDSRVGSGLKLEIQREFPSTSNNQLIKVTDDFQGSGPSLLLAFTSSTLTDKQRAYLNEVFDFDASGTPINVVSKNATVAKSPYVGVKGVLSHWTSASSPEAIIADIVPHSVLKKFARMVLKAKKSEGIEPVAVIV